MTDRSTFFWRTRATLLALGSLVCGAGAAQAAGDISGVWWIKDKSEIAHVKAADLPFTDAGKKAYEQNRAAAAAGKSLPVGPNKCVPEGLPRLMLVHLPIQILQRPEQVTIIHERNHLVRFIYLDQPHHEDPDPTYSGDTVGHWDGDALVADSIAFNPVTVIDKTGIPHSDAMHVIERFSVQDGRKTLRDEITIDDSKFYTKPWTFAVDYDKRPDVRLMEDVCTFGPPMRDQVKK